METKGEIDVAGMEHGEIRGMYNFECGRWKRTGRTRNAVSWKLGQRVFGRDRDCGQGSKDERGKKERKRLEVVVIARYRGLDRGGYRVSRNHGKETVPRQFI